jgi:hypothetical protein
LKFENFKPISTICFCSELAPGSFKTAGKSLRTYVSPPHFTAFHDPLRFSLYVIPLRSISIDVLKRRGIKIILTPRRF